MFAGPGWRTTSRSKKQKNSQSQREREGVTEKPTEFYLELVSLDASCILRHNGTGDARKEKVRMPMQRCIYVWKKQSPGPIWTSKIDQHWQNFTSRYFENQCQIFTNFPCCGTCQRNDLSWALPRQNQCSAIHIPRWWGFLDPWYLMARS